MNLISKDVMDYLSEEFRPIFESSCIEAAASKQKLKQELLLTNTLQIYLDKKGQEFIELSNYLASVTIPNSARETLDTYKNSLLKSASDEADDLLDDYLKLEILVPLKEMSDVVNEDSIISTDLYLIVSLIELYKTKNTVLYDLAQRLRLYDFVLIPALKELCLDLADIDYLPLSAEERAINYINRGLNMLTTGNIISSDDVISDELFAEAKKAVNTTTEVNPIVTQSKTPYLDTYGEDLIETVKTRGLDPVVERDEEVNQILYRLHSYKKNSVILIGPGGCGKTSIIKYIAKCIIDGNVPANMIDKRIVSLSLSSLQAGATLIGTLEERVRNVINELKASKGNIILFIDEIHTIGTSDNQNIANILKPAIAEGSITVIGATTPKEFKKYIEKDSTICRRFYPVFIDPPTKEKAISMLSAVSETYAEHLKVNIPKEIIEFIVDASKQYIHFRNLPDSCIDVLNLSAAKLSYMSLLKPDKRLTKLNRTLEKLVKKKCKLVRKCLFDEANELGERILELRNDIEDISIELEDSANWPTLSKSNVAEIIEDLTKIPASTIIEPELARINQLEKDLKETIIGQNDAIEELSIAISKNALGLRNTNKPISSFLFVGPTGVGKTLICKKTAEYMFGNTDCLIRIDGGEFSNSSTITTLLGAPPSYLGYGEQLGLFDKVRDNPYSLLLIDEFEKIHPDIINKVFLNILDEGYINLSNGIKVDFTNTIIVFTGNIGTKELEKGTLGFSNTNDTDRTKSIIKDAVNKELRPELRGRITDIIIFNKLSEVELKQILELELSKFSKQINREIVISTEAKDYLFKLTDPTYGARNTAKVVEKELGNLICNTARKLNKTNFNKISVELINDKLACKLR